MASYCQDCGLCTVDQPAPDYAKESASNDSSNDLADIISREILRNLKQEPVTESGTRKIPIGVSNRHAHLTEKTFTYLFGDDAQLSVYRGLYQEGEFASEQTITIAGNKMRAIQNLRILGPLRKYDQVELSLTDAVQIGINPPIKNSGDLTGGAPLTLIGPKRSLYIEECAIIASRHIHMTSSDAQAFGVSDGDYCKIRVGGEKGIIFENVLIRVNDNWKLQLHLDTDDANAANIRCSMSGEFYGKM